MGNSVKALESPRQSSNTGQGTRKVKIWLDRYGEGAAAAISGVMIAMAWGVSYVSATWSISLYLLSFIVGGYVKAKEGFQTLIQDKDLDVNLLMIFAAIGAACIGYWEEGAVLIFIFSLSGALETFTMARSSRDISALMELKPETAVLYQHGKESVVPIEALQLGDWVLIKPGERIPADGVVKEGGSSVNQASITGESMPVDKRCGDEVFAGTLNGQGALFVEVTKTSESTLFAKIITLVQEAQNEKPKSQIFIERFERIYARVIVLTTGVLMLTPPFLLGWSWNDTLYKAMVFLVVASPCALVASVMPAMLSAISNGARKGLLFKGGAHLENLSGVKVVAFDKTGTITHGKPEVTDLIVYQGLSESELLRCTASLESLSTHPIARAIVQQAEQRVLQLEHPSDFEALPGWGVQGKLRSYRWKIGKPDFIEPSIMDDPMKERLHQLEKQGKTVMLVEREHAVVGMIAVQDRVRSQAKQVISHLKNLGVHAAMLTGDQKITAKAIAAEVGIDLVYAELLPEDKLSIVKNLKADFGRVAMVGDGINDAPALAAATVGIGLGGAGSDAALEAADLVLMNDDLARIPEGIMLGRRLKTIMKQNMIFAISVIGILILSNFIAGIALPLGVVGHEGSTILVILNGLRLLR